MAGAEDYVGEGEIREVAEGEIEEGWGAEHAGPVYHRNDIISTVSKTRSIRQSWD